MRIGRQSGNFQLNFAALRITAEQAAAGRYVNSTFRYEILTARVCH